MTTDDKILAILEQQGKAIAEMQKAMATKDDIKNMATKTDIEQVNIRLDAHQEDIARLSTAINALPTKGDLEEAIDAAKAELKADIQDSKASIMRQIKRQGKWIEAIAEKTDTADPNKN